MLVIRDGSVTDCELTACSPICWAAKSRWKAVRERAAGSRCCWVGIIPQSTKKPIGAKVLIIEDNVSNLELMTYLLTAFGHWVSKAETGMAGLEAALSDSFDV